MSYFKAKFTKIDFFWGSTPYPTGVLYTVLPRPLSLIQGALLLRMKRERKGLTPRKKFLRRHWLCMHFFYTVSLKMSIL